MPHFETNLRRSPTVRRLLALALMSLWAGLPGGADAAETLALTVGERTSKYTLPELKRKLTTVTVEIDDPVYGKRKSFDGFELLAVLRLAGLDPETATDEIVFTAKDGYSPNTSFAKLKAHRAVLAFRETGKKDFTFGNVTQGKTQVSPAPFYLVWAEGKSVGKDVPWGYQLVSIEAVDFAKRYAKLYPATASADSQEMKGFVHFKNECIRCHSVNLQGGDLGPELNIPKNVTEYWDRDVLRAFIPNAGSFRHRSKMPPFPQLGTKEVDEILAYLVYMKDRKAAP